jgi:hypothetical protein
MAFTLPRRGNRAEEYEDAYAADARAGRFAVADGASETSFAAQWARLLVGGFVHRPPPPDRAGTWLGRLRRRWAEEVDGQPLPWYADIKRQQGAYATLLGLVIKHKAGRWRAQAVGDSCLFQVRGSELVTAFPLTRSVDFNNHPGLLGSRPEAGDSRPSARRMYGRWQAGDRFWLMTDALARWFLVGQEAGFRPWQHLGEILDGPEGGGGVGRPTPSALADWVEGLRDAGALRNDDVTLISVAL